MKKLTIRGKSAAVWVAENRGALSRIARAVRPPVTIQFVHLILRGERKSKNGHVERELRKLGAPLV